MLLRRCVANCCLLAAPSRAADPLTPWARLKTLAGTWQRTDASTPASDVQVFEFLDATNLHRAEDSHLVRLTFRWRDADHLVREEVYAANGREEVGTLMLERTR